MRVFFRPMMLKVAILVGMSACDDEKTGSTNTNFTTYTIDGTLSVSSTLTESTSGTFSYTVLDSVGNAQGNAQLLGDSFTLRGNVTGGHANIQFQDGKKYSNGYITGSETSAGLSGSFWLSSSGNGNPKGTATGSRGGGGSTTGSGGGGCDSLIGTWTWTDGIHKWEIADSTAVIKNKSIDTPGALQITYIKYTATTTAMTYYITRAAMTGSNGYDYDKPVDPPKGPYTEPYSLSSCQMTIGGKTYKKS